MTGLSMKLLGVKQLSLLLIGTLLFCHGVFGALHLLCYPPQCAAATEHAAEHQATAGAGETHEHPAGHDTSTGYFAVLVAGILGLFLGLLLKSTPLRIRLDARLPAVLRWVSAVMRSPPPPTTHSSGIQALRGTSPLYQGARDLTRTPHE